MKLIVIFSIIFFPIISFAAFLTANSVNGGVQILGGNYHSEQDMFESGVRCLEVIEPLQIENVRDESATVSALTIMDFRSLRNELGLGFSVGSDGWATGGNDFKVAFEFLKSAQETDTSIVFIYKTELKAGYEILKTPFKLTPEAKGSLDGGIEEFKRYCGDQFVYKITKGARAFVAVKIDLGTKANKRKVEAEFKLGFVDLLSLSATLRKLKESLGISGTVTITGFQEGGFAARINGIFGRGEGVANCNTTDLQNCEITIKEVLNYFSRDFSHQFDHFYTPTFGYEAAPLPNTARIISYDTRSYCKLALGDRGNLDCNEMDITSEIVELRKKHNIFKAKLENLSAIFSNPNLVLHPDYREKLSIYMDSIRQNMNSLEIARLSCQTDPWICHSTVVKTLEGLQESMENLAENIRLENRIEFCFTTGLNSRSGKIEWILKNGENKEFSFSTEENPRIGGRSCYTFDYVNQDNSFGELKMRIKSFASVSEKCKRKVKKKYLSVLNWDLSKVEITNLATGLSRSYEGNFFYKKEKCEEQEETKLFTDWKVLNPVNP